MLGDWFKIGRITQEVGRVNKLAIYWPRRKNENNAKLVIACRGLFHVRYDKKRDVG